MLYSSENAICGPECWTRHSLLLERFPGEARGGSMKKIVFACGAGNLNDKNLRSRYTHQIYSSEKKVRSVDPSAGPVIVYYWSAFPGRLAEVVCDKLGSYASIHH